VSSVAYSSYACASDASLGAGWIAVSCIAGDPLGHFRPSGGKFKKATLGQSECDSGQGANLVNEKAWIRKLVIAKLETKREAKQE
jgi:hypothetical protein